MIGESIGNYKVIAQLGSGGMGLVYLAEHPLIGSKVAIKVLHPELANNPDVVSRFFTEARSVNDIRHPNIVEIADFGNKDGRCYIIMEFLEGESLAQRLRKAGSLDDAAAARISIQVASALGAAHERGILHRDLKPDNVFLTMRPGHPEGLRVLDFGIAKLIGNPFETTHRTQTGVVIGTPFYMSPEQCLAKKDIDGRSDIYALGVMLYELVTGGLPFPFESLGELIVAHTGTQPAPPTARNPRVSAEMSAIIMRTLEKDPNRRFQTMGELIDALTPIAGVPISGQFVPPLAQTMPPAQRTTPVPVTPTTLSSAAGSRDASDDDALPTRSRVPLLIGGAAVLGGIAVVAVMLSSGGSGSGEEQTPVAAGPVTAPSAPPETAPSEAAPRAVVPAEATPIEVVVTATPAAELFIGDVDLGITPVSVEVPADGTSVEIELRASGYEPKRLELDAKSGSEVAVALDKSKRTAGKRKRRGTSSDSDAAKKKKKSTFTVKPIE